MDSRKNYALAIAGIIFTAALLCCHSASAESLKQTVSELKPLVLHYGANNLQWNGQDLLIVRGKFENGNAWGGDAYTVLVKKKDGSWQLVRHENGGWEGVLTTTQPHTEEDSISAVSFLIPKKDTDSNITALYLLTTHRNYKESPINIAPATFTLDVVRPDKDFGIYYFHKLESESSKARYCNADSAAYHELDIPLPGDGTEFPCAND
ncbi:MAG: hypothetical protein KGI29_06720 [Pseudomonadota bacterium]|nr:hypothetical protein [Pseudomonadota bacterium]MDE3037563.1 hypothetical protein [Pseudomonadota bacterium]